MAIGNDYDGMSYRFNYFADKKKLHFSVSFDTYQEITDVCGDYCLKKYYPNLAVIKPPQEDFNITLEIDLSKIKSLPKIPKNCKPEEKEEIIKNRQELTTENDKFISEIKDSISRMKRNFFASPFEFILENYNTGNKDTHCFGFRADEKIWVMPNENKKTFSVYFSLNFTDETDSIIATQIFNEFEEVRRHVNDAPMFEIFKKEQDLPEVFKQKFPSAKDSINKNTLVLHICLFDNHISQEKLKNTVTMLQGFRQYIHYHIHANKTYLHSRIRQKTQKTLRQVNLARYEIESIKIYRGRKGKGVTVDMGNEGGNTEEIVLRG